MSEAETTELARRAQAGDPAAADEVVARFARRLVVLAEAHLGRRLAGRLDGEDVVQSVFRTFFRRCSEGEFQLDSTGGMWRLLVKITVLKARAKGRFHTADRRNVAAEVGAPEGVLFDALGHEPGPDEAAALVDQIEALLRGLPELHGEVLRLRLAGHSVAEVAAGLGITRQGVYRMLAVLQQRLEREVDAA
jgi:RNA polymerase sigma-70 factor (ECF subfamily)